MCVRARARRSLSRRDSTPATARRRSTHSISTTFFTPSIPTRVVCSFGVASAPLALPPRLDSCDGAATGLRRCSLDSGEVSEDACGCADKPIPRAKMLVFDKAKIGTPVPVYAE